MKEIYIYTLFELYKVIFVSQLNQKALLGPGCKTYRVNLCFYVLSPAMKGFGNQIKGSVVTALNKNFLACLAPQSH